tara:strand:- start:2744 stop:3688 length:945 start_codon:yes stop_codon:yes gene_type:complete
MNYSIARFEELVPSSLPFVEGKLEGHKERKNYSIVGPGVAEDSKQFIKIPKPHSFNLGAVSAMPKNGSGLHSHTTAEVFLIYSGKWKFYWGADGKNKTILNAGDIISMPTNMFRGFENAGENEGLIFVILGKDDPGIITWVPDVLNRAKKTGMALLDDNSLIDLSNEKIPDGKNLLKPINEQEIKNFDNYSESDFNDFISRYETKSNSEFVLNNGFKCKQVIGNNFQNKITDPIIKHNTGFNLNVLSAKKGHIEKLNFEKPTVFFSQKGSWEIIIESSKIVLGARDTISVPTNMDISIQIDEKDEGQLNCVTQI